MVQAYILVQTEVGRARDVAAAIRDIAGVVRVDAVTGPYDVVVLTEARSVDELGKMIVSNVQLVPGITRTTPAISRIAAATSRARPTSVCTRMYAWTTTRLLLRRAARLAREPTARRGGRMVRGRIT